MFFIRYSDKLEDKRINREEDKEAKFNKNEEEHDDQTAEEAYYDQLLNV